MQAMQTDLAIVKTDVATLKTDVKGLKIDVKSLLDWRKKMINAQEEKTAYTIENTLRTYCTTCVVKRLDIKIFYNTAGREITDFDSCFLVSTEISAPPRRQSSRRQERLLSASVRRLNSVSSSVSEPYLVLVENKTTIDKKIIDNKLRQHGAIKANIASAKSMSASFHQNFTSMVTRYEVDKYPTKIYMVFACDSMSYKTTEYLKLINKGMSEQEYEIITVDLIKEDRTYKELAANQADLKAASSFSTIKAVLQGLPPNTSGVAHLLDSMPDFNDIRDTLSSVVGIIGHIVQDKLTLDTISTFVL